MPDLQAAIEDYLAALPDEDWRALTARVRPPTIFSRSPEKGADSCGSHAHNTDRQER